MEENWGEGFIDACKKQKDADLSESDAAACSVPFRPEGNHVPIEWVDWLYAELDKINKMNLEDIVWTKGGEVFETKEADIKDFLFCGLNNTHFVSSRYWKKKE